MTYCIGGCGGNGENGEYATTKNMVGMVFGRKGENGGICLIR